MHKSLFELISQKNITGAVIASINDKAISFEAAGFRNAHQKQPVDERTIFCVASLTKPLIAYLVLRLVDLGLMRLNDVLVGLAQGPKITVGDVLTHTSGLGNSNAHGASTIYFCPGSRFSYSSTGFKVLQWHIEKMLSKPIEDIVRNFVFEPLSMFDSSLVWQNKFEQTTAYPTEMGVQLEPIRSLIANASYSLRTTAKDYAYFMSAVLKGVGLRKGTWLEWFRPRVFVSKQRIVNLGLAPVNFNADVAWGLGWGLETRAGTFFHWGQIEGMQTYVIGSIDTQSAKVLLTNSGNGLDIIDIVSNCVVPGYHPAVEWIQLGVD